MSMRQVFLECKPDETFVQTLGVPRKAIIHSNDKGGVCRRLSNSKFMIGLIDQDPMSAQPSYVRLLREVDEKYHVIQYRDDIRSHTVLALCPYLEAWILSACKLSRIDIQTFNLPNEPRKLHEIINSRLPKFKELIDELVGQGNPALLYVRSFLLSEQQ